MNLKYTLILLYLLITLLPVQSQSNTKKQPSLEEIGTNAFQGATIGKGIILPASLKNIGNNAFQNSTIPCMDFTKCVNLEQIRPNAFNSTKLTIVNVLDFTNSSKLRCYISGTQSGSSFASFSGKIILPKEVIKVLHKNSLKTIAESAFENSTIGSIDLLGCGNLDIIGVSAFRNMKLTENTKIDLSVISKLATISNTAFQNSNMTKLILPDALKYIGNNAFAGCTKLDAITSYNPVPSGLGTTVFSGVDTERCKLLVPETSLSRYGNTAQWQDFFRILAIGSEPVYPDPSAPIAPIDPLDPSEELCKNAEDVIQFTYDASGNRIKKEILLTTTRSTESIETPRQFLDEIANRTITIYPNPTRGQLMVEIADQSDILSGTLTILNLKGQMVAKQTISQKQISLDISNEPAGTYILHISINGETSTWKIIKQ